MAAPRSSVGLVLVGGHLGLPRSVHPGGCWWAERFVGSPLQARLQRRCNPGRGWVRASDGGSGMRAREPDEQGYVERDGVRIAYEVVRRRATTTVAVPADRHDRAQPGVEGAGAVPRAALPGGHDRPARATAVRPADRPGGVRRPRVRRRHDRGAWTTSASSRAVLVGICFTRLAGAALRRAAPRPRAGRRGDRAVRPRPRHRRCRAGRRPRRASTTSCRRTRAGSSTTGTTGCDGLAGLRRVLLRPAAARAALDQAARGRRRLGDGHDAARSMLAEPRTPPGTPRPSRRPRRCCAAIDPPVLVIQGTEDRCQPLGRSSTRRPS